MKRNASPAEPAMALAEEYARQHGNPHLAEEGLSQSRDVLLADGVALRVGDLAQDLRKYENEVDKILDARDGSMTTKEALRKLVRDSDKGAAWT